MGCFGNDGAFCFHGVLKVSERGLDTGLAFFVWHELSVEDFSLGTEYWMEQNNDDSQISDYIITRNFNFCLSYSTVSSFLCFFSHAFHPAARFISDWRGNSDGANRNLWREAESLNPNPSPVCKSERLHA